MARNMEKRREYQRDYQKKKYEEARATRPFLPSEFDKYEYKIVPNTWRNLVATPRMQQDTPEVMSPLVKDLLRGKTVFVDYTLPFGQSHHPFRTLYSYFNTRGYRLRIHVLDVVEKEEYRKLLMWAEPVKPIKLLEKSAQGGRSTVGLSSPKRTIGVRIPAALPNYP